VPVADARGGRDAIAVLRSPAIAWARQNRFKLTLDQLFNESRTALSIGSNQVSKRRSAASLSS
jgi:hypothetical protein